MGMIKAKGRLQLWAAKTVPVHATCAGSVSKFPVPDARAGQATKGVMKIVCPEIIKQQECLIALAQRGAHVAAAADQLLDMGMERWQIGAVLGREKPIQAITLSCPSGHVAAGQLALGQPFERFTELFRHGPLVAECEVLETYAALMELGAAVQVSPVHWQAGAVIGSGRVVDVRAGALRPGAKRVVMTVSEALMEYPLGTEVSIQIRVPKHAGLLDNEAALGRVRASTPSPASASILPPRGISRPLAVRQAERAAVAAARAQGVPEAEIRQAQLLASTEDGIEIAAQIPAVLYPVAPNVPRMTLTRKHWAEAKVETVAVSRWPGNEAGAGIGSAAAAPAPVVLPRAAVWIAAKGRGSVLAHIGPGTFAVLPVTPGSIGSVVEIDGSLPEGLTVMADLSGGAARLRAALKGTKEEGRADELLAAVGSVGAPKRGRSIQV